jgi:hypothetical protein
VVTAVSTAGHTADAVRYSRRAFRPDARLADVRRGRGPL